MYSKDLQANYEASGIPSKVVKIKNGSGPGHMTVKQRELRLRAEGMNKLDSLKEL